MKKIWLMMLAIVMSIGAAGCGSDANPVGTWHVHFDVSCDGTYGQTDWHISSNGTFVDVRGDAGTWSVATAAITLTYSNGTVYSGTVENNNASMSGRMNNAQGQPVCWDATKISSTP